MHAEAIGWLGGALLGLCAVPQAWHTHKQKSAEGVSAIMVLMWGTGEALALAYSLQLYEVPWPLVANYMVNMACLAVIAGYKWKDSRVPAKR